MNEDCHHNNDLSQIIEFGTFSPTINIILTLAIIGLSGGFLHCTTMCGPFVIAQISTKITNQNEILHCNRFKSSLLFPYHLGRITTYTILGLIAGSLTDVINNYISYKYIASFFLMLAGVSFFIYSISQYNNFIKLKLPKFIYNNRVLNYFRNLAFVIDIKRSFINHYLLGVYLGFIPCGMLYGALFIAASQQDPLLSAASMFVFTVFTIPGLFTVGYLSYFLRQYFYKYIEKMFKLFILATSILMFYFSLKFIL